MVRIPHPPPLPDEVHERERPRVGEKRQPPKPPKNPDLSLTERRQRGD